TIGSDNDRLQEPERANAFGEPRQVAQVKPDSIGDDDSGDGHSRRLAIRYLRHSSSPAATRTPGRISRAGDPAFSARAKRSIRISLPRIRRSHGNRLSGDPTAHPSDAIAALPGRR